MSPVAVAKLASAQETILFNRPLSATPAYIRQPEASFAVLPAAPAPGTIASPPTIRMPEVGSPAGLAAVEMGTDSGTLAMFAFLNGKAPRSNQPVRTVGAVEFAG